MSKDTNWIIENDKVKVGNSFKSLSDLKLEFYFEIGFACLMVVVAVFMVSIQIIFTLLCLLIAIVVAVVSVGTYSAYSALDQSLGSTRRTIKKRKQKKVAKKENNKTVDRFKELKIKRKAKEEEALINSVACKLVKTTGKNKEKYLAKLDKNSQVKLIDNDVNYEGIIVGSLNAKTVKKLDEYNHCRKEVEIVEVSKNEKDKYQVEVKINIYK